MEPEVRVLVTGAHGQLGTEVVTHCESEGDLVYALAHGDLDITDRVAVLEAVAAVRPDAIINCAAWTAVDACESDRARSFAVNADAPVWLADAALACRAHLVHLSTDYVFSGETEVPYAEDDIPAPINVYGESKRAGESGLLQHPASTAIVRTSWLCGAHGGNVVKTVMTAAAAGASLRFVDDQWGSPTFTADLAPLLRQIAVDRFPGLVHATNEGVLTWFRFARSILEAAGHDPDMVQPISTQELVPPRAARRPRFSALANTKRSPIGSSLLPHFEPSLHRLVRVLQDT